MPIPFRRLAEVQLLHAAGDGMVAVALANTLFFAVPIGEARDKVGLYLALTMAPFAVLSPLVGPWLDRRSGSYKVAIILGAGGRAVLAVLLATRTDRVALYPLAFGLLVLSRIHGVSRSALLPDVLPPDRSPMWGNARLAVISVVGGALGAGLAAGANLVGGAGLALGIAVVVFSTAVVPAVRLPRSRTKDTEAAGADDYRALLSSRLLAAGVAMGASRAAVGFLTFLLAFLLRAEGEQGRGFAVVIAAAGIGGFAGAVVAPALRAVIREMLLLQVSLAAMVVAALWAAGSFNVPRAAVVAGVVGLATASGRLAFDSLLQGDAPSTVRGRTFARYETIFQLCWVGGAGLATAVPFRAAAGLRSLALIASGGVAFTILGLIRRRPTRRRATSPPEAAG